MLLIGSKAISYNLPFSRNRKSDFDLIATPDEVMDFIDAIKALNFHHKFSKERKKSHIFVMGRHFEFFLYVSGDGSSNELFANANKNQPMSSHDFENTRITYTIASLETLYLIKKSHIYFPVKWGKNIADYHLLKTFSSTPTEMELKSYEVRVQEVKDRHKNTNINLKMSNEEFFKKSEEKVKRVYEHDDIHKIVAFYELPLYEKVKKDKSKAYISLDEFNTLSFEDKIKMVQEEAFAISLERYVIPLIEKHKEEGTSPFINNNLYFNKAIQRICTNLTQGYFREFALENWPKIRRNNVNYVEKFIKSSGELKKREKNEKR